ncbi:hypothetical protein D2V17_15745 [Aurantiacibacter xanthus]|uniref:Uncharacterized protein n=2 Tax=Aurantiacibacter xanthus TaxID=1784712 RepID=A0A3A1P0J9_9SPHN|nr:hypothetical protein D2V17_15745 [Aurantiacibacter xanthus]
MIPEPEQPDVSSKIVVLGFGLVRFDRWPVLPQPPQIIAGVLVVGAVLSMVLKETAPTTKSGPMDELADAPVTGAV